MNRSRPNHCVIGYDLRRIEISLEVGILHELHVAEIGESFTANRVVGGVDAKIEIETGEVVDRIVVFAAGQPPDGHAAGIASMRFDESIQLRLNPGDDLAALLIRRLRQSLGRHVLLRERSLDALPSEVRVSHRFGGSQLFQVNARGCDAASVALEAILFQNRSWVGWWAVRAAHLYGGHAKHCARTGRESDLPSPRWRNLMQQHQGSALNS